MFGKPLFQLLAVLIAVALLACAAQGATIETVRVGNPGNAVDTQYGTSGHGAVDYAYRIGKYEVTAGQYCEFLNAVARSDPYGLYNRSMDSDFYGCQITQNGTDGHYTYDFSGGTVESPESTAADWQNRPVNYVSFWDACRFANWLHNGQGSGDTEEGAYTLMADMTDNTITRNAGAKVWIPSADEWYKAAYYDPSLNDAAGGYYVYPTSSDATPSNDLVEPTDAGNNATFYDDGFTIGSPYYRTEVGAHENSDSPYGTFDQGGNVWEWNEQIVYGTGARCLRGGSFGHHDIPLTARYGSHITPVAESCLGGFRVATIPEPSAVVLGIIGALCCLPWRKRVS